MSEQKTQIPIDAILDLLHLQKFMKRNDLRMHLVSRGYVLTDRGLRKAIEYMITECHYAIASSEKGYSLITTEKDLDEAMQYLKEKATSISVRANCLLRNWKEKERSAQIQLFI